MVASPWGFPHVIVGLVASPRGSPPPPLPPGAPPDAGNIQVFVLPPTPSELYVSQSPKLRCVVTSLPSDEGLVVTWTRRGGHAPRPNPLELKAQFNGTFTATSVLPISTGDWENGEGFSCSVRHGELPSPVTRTIKKKAGRAWGRGGMGWGAGPRQQRDPQGVQQDAFHHHEFHHDEFHHDETITMNSTMMSPP